MKAELIESRLAPKRVVVILLIGLISLGCTFWLTEHNELGTDIQLAYLIMTGVCWACVSVLIFEKRKTGVIFTGTGYVLLLVSVILCWASTIASEYFDSYFYPVIIMPFLLAAVSEGTIACLFSLYLCAIPALVGNESVYVLYAHVMMIAIGSVLAEVRRIRPKKFRILISLLAVISSMFCSVVFYYFTFLELPSINRLDVYVFCGIIFIVAFPIFELMSHFTHRERIASYEKILDDEYSLIQDMRRFSESEYRHAKKVSWLSGICAEEIGADRLTAMAGGMYYRLGQIIGEPHIKNAVRTAYKQCFPPEVITILEEYEAAERLPSTRESAVVHMVNAVITRLELFGEDVAGSDWNQNMVVYQPLNEFSEKGIYDESGISMNQFLKIRDRLFKEDLL